MKKIIGICLGLLLMVTMSGCGASTKDLGETLNEKSYNVEKMEFFGDKFQRQITLKRAKRNLLLDFMVKIIIFLDISFMVEIIQTVMDILLLN